jgi:hypothetical protein
MPDSFKEVRHRILWTVLSLLILPVCLQPPSIMAQTTLNPSMPCNAIGNYGTNAEQTAIDTAVETGTQAQFAAAVEAAENTRGTMVGCPGSTYTYDTTRTPTAPSFATVLANWNTQHVPNITSYSTACPDIGRNGSGYALATYYTALAGYPSNQTQLINIANMQLATQYSSSTVGGNPLNAGSFGYINTSPSNACYLTVNGGSQALGANVSNYCSTVPANCITYTSGLFAGDTFLFNDIGDPDLVPDGSMGFDHGWAGVMLLEATLQQNRSLYPQFQTALTLAGQWSINEPPVRDTNYTAKSVWLLAELYDETGNQQYYTALMYKLNHDMLVDILMPDPNNPANVYGMTPAMPFSSLTTVAQLPGRVWDGHNSLPSYMPMNAWALVEAYVALRDQGNTTDAATIRPYAIAILNNIAYEINVLGVPNLGKTQLPVALLLGQWKIADYEKVPGGSGNTNWLNAAWKLWNSGAATTFGTGTPSAALYVLYLSGTKYISLNQRYKSLFCTGK